MVSEMPLLGVVNEEDPEPMQTIYLWLYLDVGPAIGKFIFSYSLSFPPASISLLALFQTLRRHWSRLLRQRLDFSTPSQVVVTSGLVGSGRRWSRSDWQCKHSCCRHGDVSVETTRRARALRTRSMSLVLFFYLGSLVKERSSWPSNFWPAHRRVDCESWD